MVTCGHGGGRLAPAARTPSSLRRQEQPGADMAQELVRELLSAPICPHSSRGSEATGIEGINFKVYTPHAVYTKPNLFRASSSDMLAAALRVCLSARLLGRSLPLIAMSLSLLGTTGGWRERDYNVGGNQRMAASCGFPGTGRQSPGCSARCSEPASGRGADPECFCTPENRVRWCEPPEPFNGIVIYLWISIVPPARRT